MTSRSGTGMEDYTEFVDDFISDACLEAGRQTASSWLPVRGELVTAFLPLSQRPGASLVEVGEFTKDGISHPWYLARAGHEGDVYSGVCSFHLPGARIYVAGRELVASRYEVMVQAGESLRWRPINGPSGLRDLAPVTSGLMRRSLSDHVMPRFVARLKSHQGVVYGTLTNDGTAFLGFQPGSLITTNYTTGDYEVLTDSKFGEGLGAPDSAPPDDKIKASIGRLATDNEMAQVKKGDRYSTAATFRQALEEIPPVIMGFNKLVTGNHESALRLRLYPQNITKDTFICNAEAWGETYLYNVTANWIAISEPTWQTGVLKTKADNPSALLDSRVNFAVPFSSPPMIFVCFSGLDMVGHWDFRVQATNIDHTGFYISLIRNAETKVGAARVSWVAIPGEDVLKRKNAWIGRFSTNTGSAVYDGTRTWTGHVKFGFEFKRTPRIFVGVDELSFTRDRGLRMYAGAAKVSKTGLDWNINKWGDSVMKGAGASYLAVDCE